MYLVLYSYDCGIEVVLMFVCFYIIQMGNHINIDTGKWTALDAGIGAGVDSYFEYLVKGSILFHKAELKEMFNGKMLLISIDV